MKLLVPYSDEGYNPCILRRGPFLPNLTVNETYKTLIRPLVKQPSAQKFIESVLQRNDIDWATVYLLPQKTTIESRMHIVQYKILNNILYLNNRLYKYGYIEFPLCSLCKSCDKNDGSIFFAAVARLCNCRDRYLIGVRNVSLCQCWSQVQQFLVFGISMTKKANSLTIFLCYLNISFMQIEI